MPGRKGGIEQCSCGLWYPLGGSAYCIANRHGKKEAAYPATNRHVNHLELTAEVFCAECGSPLSAELKLEEYGHVVIRVIPHICAVADPTEIPKGVAA